MSDGTITTITILLFVFVLSAFIWPIALGIHLEMEGRKKRGEPPAYDERQKLARLRAGSHAMYALLFLLDEIGPGSGFMRADADLVRVGVGLHPARWIFQLEGQAEGRRSHGDHVLPADGDVCPFLL